MLGSARLVARRAAVAAQPAARGLASAASVADARCNRRDAHLPARTSPRWRSSDTSLASLTHDSSSLHRVSCTFIMAKQKQKVTVPGMLGWTLLETAHHHGMLTHACTGDQPWDYNTFGEGPMHAQDHVVVSRDYFDKTGPVGYQEANVLDKEVDEEDLTPTCAKPRSLVAPAPTSPADPLRSPAARSPAGNPSTACGGV